jgi:GDPmannose 4,6-dehydratase
MYSNLVRKSALITGITGQDGSYLAELLLNKGYVVHGLIRRSSTVERWRIDHLHQRYTEGKDFFLHYGDMHDDASLIHALQFSKPIEIYNLAAQSHVRISFDTPVGTTDVVALGTVRLLEAVRKICPDTRIYQASSSEMFGSYPPPQSEETPFHPRSPYAVGKLFSHWMVKNYRDGYGLHASNGILFNHESSRRGENFVTRKIARGAAAIATGRAKTLTLGNLDATRDWGFAPEYVNAMWMVLQNNKPSDFIVGTGHSYSIKNFLNWSFNYLNLNWEDYIRFDPALIRPTEVDQLCADTNQIKTNLNWRPKIYGKSLAEIMVDAELERIKSCNLMVDAWKFTSE